ncbi:MAG: 1-acyl-sn-glycerol-3-phosphate acyltransferase [Pseudomonadota bacterium]
MRRLAEWIYGTYALIVWAVLIFIVFCPLIILGPTLAIRRAIGRAAVKITMAACFAPLHVRGLERLPAGACIVVSNHASYIDGLVLTAALPSRFTFVVQDGAARWPYVGLVIRRMGVSFVNRVSAHEGARQTRELIRRLQNGESLTVFAEGTFKGPPGLLPFRKGAFLMAAKTGVPVVPAVIRGTRRFLGGDVHWPRHSRIEIEIFEPIAAHTDSLTTMQRARATVLKHCGEPDTVK